ncbi:chorismate-binding protein [Succinimonas sp.]|uniref:chorismate-binding protein n=1 Tax=Succinimonas sp. TaxID=1936151 RepID=UPI0038700B83
MNSFPKTLPSVSDAPEAELPDTRDLPFPAARGLIGVLTDPALRDSFPGRSLRVFSDLRGGLYLGFFLDETLSAVTEAPEHEGPDSFFFLESPFACPPVITRHVPDVFLEFPAPPEDGTFPPAASAGDRSAKLHFRRGLPRDFAARILSALDSFPQDIPPVLPRESDLSAEALHLFPDYQSFRDTVLRAQENMRQGKFHKVVLSRRAEIILKTAPNPPDLLRDLIFRRLAQEPCGTYFYACLAGPEDSLFVSFSPETLLQSRGREFRTEALAGSCPPGQGSVLLRDAKNIQENSIVAEEIKERLAELALSLCIGPLTLKSLDYIEHLKTPISGLLKEGAAPLEVSRKLHPTPAVLGFPREPALSFLRVAGLLPESLYAGLGGCIRTGVSGDGDRLTLAVLLRSARVHSRSVTLYGGAGILPASRPESEWRETGSKMKAACEALCLPRDLISIITDLPAGTESGQLQTN